MDLLQYKIENKFTYHDMAALLGVTPSTVHGWINRKANPTKKHRLKIEKKLGIVISEKQENSNI